MEAVQITLLSIQIIIAIFLILIVLLQKSGTDSLGGIGGGSGGANAVISSKASANILTKITMILVILFFVNSLALAVIASKSTSSSKIQDYIEKSADEPKEVAPVSVPDVE